MIRVVELFAGVGGFRLGLEGWKGKSSSSRYTQKIRPGFKVVWSNQYEPLTPNKQHANWVYKNAWPKSNHSEVDIEEVIEKNFESIPDHDLLVGGFPCQDYSVATTLKNSKGLVGTKGVLWWSIYNILQKKKNKKPDYLFLENVDRLLSSPASQRGRDFAVMLSCLYKQGYAVEWRIINAADYGMPQRRRRVYLLAYKKGSSVFNTLSSKDSSDIIESLGVIGSAFTAKREGDVFHFKLSKDFDSVSKDFNKSGKSNHFKNSGFMINGKVFTAKTKAVYAGDEKFLNDVIETENIPEEFYIDENKPIKKEEIEQVDGSIKVITNVGEKWRYLKESKDQWKRNKTHGYKYRYSEGGVSFPDPTHKPSRTIITGEGGKSPSRFKHVIQEGEKLRRLLPVELERLNMFPDNHTLYENITDTKRAFFMGNALVVGVVEKISRALLKQTK